MEKYNLALSIAAILTSPIVYNEFHKLLNVYFEKLYVSEAIKKVDNIRKGNKLGNKLSFHIDIEKVILSCTTSFFNVRNKINIKDKISVNSLIILFIFVFLS